ncbi:tetratricopeptide repeat protein [Actinoplanes solisilvae]|uniref:tetratricopeptide repeat protein n=1 Tax=Actinoplanes solisilvae TaxID=2486853 RepID=UPI000FDBEDFA|nr:hypothetical protein [Actinoplanes solisilvae]
MDADKSRPVRRPSVPGARPQPIRRPRRLAQPDLPSGSQRDVRDLLHGLHEKAGRPSLSVLEKRIADDDRLDGAPKKDVIHRIISWGGPARLDDVRAVARILARDCGQDEFAVAAQVARLTELPEPAGTTTADPGRPISVCDPFALEVHRAITVPGRSRRLTQLPVYVDRDHDRRMREIADSALTGSSRMITLVGGSSTGKTRACWELAQYVERRQPELWRIWHPFDPTRPEAAADELGHVGRNTIVWLNEAQLYLAPLGRQLGERIAAGLRTLLADDKRRPVLVLATMWPGHWTKLTNRPMDEGLSDPHAQVRELLDATDVDVPEAFTPSDLTDLDTKNDPRLHHAGKNATGGRITQYLAGAPMLFDRYRKAPPAARALLDVAVDARRLGHPPAIPRALLEEAAAGYLDDDAWALNDQDHWFEQALAYTAEPCNGIRGLLTPLRPRPGEDTQHGGPVYRLADYVEQAGATPRADVYPPPSFWQAASRTVQDAGALRVLGWAAEQRGRYRHAALLYRASVDHGELASFKALLRLVELTGSPSDTVVDLCRGAAARGSTDALNHLAFMRERIGDLRGAADLYGQASDLGDTGALRALARLSELSGDEHGAARFARAAADGDRRTAEQPGERAGDLDRAKIFSKRAIRPQDLDDQDARLRRQAVERAHNNALIELVRDRRRAGDLAGAVAAAWEAAERGQTSILSQLALHLDGEGDPDEAARLAHEAADRGNPIVLSRLARRRELAGDPNAAAGLYRAAVNRANTNAMINLARLRETAGDVESAERIRRFGLSADGSPAEPWTV